MHVCAVFISKNPKKMTFFWELSRRHVSFPRILILIMASYPSQRGSNFCRFLASDVEKITIFWESTLCEIIAFFSDAPDLVQNKIPKNVTFLGNFPGCIFHHVSFSWLCFTLCFLGGPRRPVDFFGVRKNEKKLRTPRKNARKNDVFSHDTIMCFLAPALSLRRRIPYLSANSLEPRISRDQHIQTCQLKTTNVKIHPAVPKVYTYLISFGQMKMANASRNFGEHFGGVESLEWCNPRLPQECPKKDAKKKRFFGHLKKCCFFGPRLPDDDPKKSWLSGWLAIWLAGWLAIWLAGWLAI